MRTDLSFLTDIRYPIRDALREIGTRGTVILSPEGINLFLSGSRDKIDASWEIITGYGPYADLEYKESFSDDIAFNRMLVKLKKEIIPAGVHDVDPVEKTGPRIEAMTLKEWLDDGRDILLLDTRNDYEVKLGTFSRATHLNIDSFRSFNDALAKLDDSARDKPVVMFCTGGIRCEKASPIMLNHGFSEVYQLEGGILKYFEEVGGEHYDGECFVFDHRVAVDHNLQETETVQCFRCQEPLTTEQQQSGRYRLGEYCPYCFHRMTASPGDD